MKIKKFMYAYLKIFCKFHQVFMIFFCETLKLYSTKNYCNPQYKSKSNYIAKDYDKRT